RKRLRGGFWRNFLVKYPESHEMYCRMREISDRLQELRKDPELAATAMFRSAEDHLYRGQCNCPYWHGAFGGLYLPHLRNAIYYHLITADSLIEQLQGKAGRWVEVASRDFNLDARQEVRLASDQMVGYVSPANGGHLYELDVRGARTNLLATLNRRPEPYHETILAHATGGGDGANETASVSGDLKFKQEDLHLKLGYDNYPRKSLVDHVLPAGMSLEAFQQNDGFLEEAETAVFQTTLKREDGRVSAVLERRCQWGDQSPVLTKTLTLDSSSPSMLHVDYELTELQPGTPVHFAIEFNFSSMASQADDRYYYNQDGVSLGRLGSQQELHEQNRFGLVDEWLGLDASLEISRPTNIWAYPVETVSQSEGGFELVHQSCAVILRWEFTPEQSEWKTSIGLLLDSSAAQARRLAAKAESQSMAVEL
ncbi:MAG: alpha-amylase, partial [Planctomyces sp.]|nr:alpha-amylase [Planctomyces sp.]